MKTKTKNQETTLGFFSRVASFFKRATLRPVKADGTVAEWLQGYFTGKTVKSGVRVDSMSALGVPAINQAVRIYAETIASLPWEVFSESNGNKEKSTGHPVYNLINNSPSRLYTSYTFRKTLITHFMTYGTACAAIERNGVGRPVNLAIIQPGDVEPFLAVMEDGQTLLFFKVVFRLKKDGPIIWERTLPDYDVIYLQDTTMDGITGMSRVDLCKEAIGLSIASTEYPARYIKNGGHFNGILHTEQPLKKEQVEQIRDKWNARVGIDATGETPLLPFGIKYQPISTDPDKMTLTDIRRFQIEEVSRIFNLPVHMLNHLDKMSFSNIEVMDISTVKYSFRPVVKMIEQEVNRKLFRKDEQGRTYSRFNLEALLRGDAKTRAEYYQAMRTIGAMSANEVRELENMNRVEGLDNYDNPNITTPNNQDNDRASDIQD